MGSAVCQEALAAGFAVSVISRSGGQGSRLQVLRAPPTSGSWLHDWHSRRPPATSMPSTLHSCHDGDPTVTHEVTHDALAMPGTPPPVREPWVQRVEYLRGDALEPRTYQDFLPGGRLVCWQLLCADRAIIQPKDGMYDGATPKHGRGCRQGLHDVGAFCLLNMLLS